MDVQKNADRFSGFAALYESVRPAVPDYPIRIILRYLGYVPKRLADIGCGTGLSTVVWKDRCETVVGVEPSGDMLAVAKQKEGGNVRFIPGYGHDTGLETDSCDIVVCSQSFHWMEPETTLAEINRILKKGGIFAVIDCDWPPVSTWKTDKAYEDLHEKAGKWEAEIPDVKDTYVRYDKERHLANIKNSGFFRYAREIVFSNAEECSEERFIGLLMSQGRVQAVMKRHPELLKEELENLKKAVHESFNGEKLSIEFSYRMRIAVK